MRQRNIKNIGEKLALYSRFLVDEPKGRAGRWNEVFGNSRPIYLEIGCGKGRFLSGCARLRRDVNFIGIEGQSNVALRTLEKADAAGLENLRVVISYVDDLSEYFGEGELAGIFLNFSDPWPKARHVKRRLTYFSRLENYGKALAPEGFIEFRTDNDGLFDFTLAQIELAGMKADRVARDLRGPRAQEIDARPQVGQANGGRPQPEPANGPRPQPAQPSGAADGFAVSVTTEYEDRFVAEGKNINYVRFR